jgi:excisionase family DNA binding protein
MGRIPPAPADSRSASVADSPLRTTTEATFTPPASESPEEPELTADTIAPVVSAPALYRVSDMVTVLMSRSVVYELIRSGRLKTVKEGRTRLVPAVAISEYVELLMRESGVIANDQAA